MLRRLLAVALICAVAVAAADADGSTTERTTGIDGYVPRRWLSFIGIGCFGGSAIVQCVHWWRNGRHRYMLPLLLGMIFMAAGFGVRVYYAKVWQDSGLSVYIATTMLILLSPCLYLAQDYMLLHRLADALGEDVAQRCLFIRSSWITKIFVSADVFTFLLQAGGGGMSAGSADMAQTGQKIALVGLFIQLFFFIGFCALLAVLIYRVRANYPHLRYPPKPFRFGDGFSGFSTDPIEDWRPLAVVLALTCVGIIIRSVFRLVEYAQGHGGYLKTTEVWFYLLDALPLWISMTLFCVIWPPRVLDGVEAGAGEAAREPYQPYDRHASWSRVPEERVGMTKLQSNGSY
ncbi:hypothetical protein JCM6882_001044 [Rhodosporidiobolus microsporus]